MAQPSEPKPVKLFMGLIIAPGRVTYEQPLVKLKRMYGDIDLASPEYPFEYTNYYTKEMGASLKRRFISFKKLITPDKLALIKQQTNRIEDAFAVRQSRGPARRTINIDPGYLDTARIVLATTKDFAHRIYIGAKIYAEITLLYRGNTFVPLEWTYPDFRTQTYWPFFLQVRATYAKQVSA